MFDLDAWQEVWSTLRKNRLRAILTACGVFWGMFMLMVLLGLGAGLERGVVRSLGGMALHSVYVWSQRTSIPYKGLQPGRYVKFNNRDIEAIARVTGVTYVAPRLQLGGWRDGQNITRGSKTGNFNVVGDVPEFPLVEPLVLKRGRFFNGFDMAEKRKVAVVGESVTKELFEPDQDPVGQYIQVKGVNFLIVGEVKSLKFGDEGEKLSATVFIPFATFQNAFNQRDRIGWFTIGTDPKYPAVWVENAIKLALAEKHRIHPNDNQAFGSFNAADKFEKIQGLFRGIRLFVWMVGALTLGAGMLGVSNILLITVKERTREIGIRKALGATPGSIVRMVVKESVVLTMLAGYLGLVAAVATLEGFASVLAKLPEAPVTRPEVDFKAALVAQCLLIAAGLIAAIMPARHAARVHPVEALRSE
ncbi:MAG TPA: ABC transporter permease [Polyangiaceae bacterium]|nr:ABC transporter permease [Polyangiaceae bacterium]